MKFVIIFHTLIVKLSNNSEPLIGTKIPLLSVLMNASKWPKLPFTENQTITENQCTSKKKNNRKNKRMNLKDQKFDS